MKVSKTIRKYRYIRWMRPEEMHQASMDWLAELNFARDEQMFLNRLIQTYTEALSDGSIFADSKTLIGQLFDKQRELVTLREQVSKHANQLDIMVDHVDQLTMEKAYRQTHKELTKSMNLYLSEYKLLKEEIFQIISGVLRERKKTL